MNGEVRRLTKGESVERSLGEAERHCYEIELVAGEYVEVEASQEDGLDVALTLELEGEASLTFDFERQGIDGQEPEALFWIAPRKGVIHFHLEGYEEDVGDYELRVVRREAARTADYERVSAIHDLARADGYRRRAASLSGAEALRLRESAIGAYELAAEELVELGEPQFAVVALERLSWIYFDLRRPVKELKVLRRAIEVGDQSPDLTRRAWARSRAAELLGLRGNSQEALTLNLAARALYQRLGKHTEAMLVATAQGSNYLRQAEFVKAEQLFDETLEYFQEVGDSANVAQVMLHFAVLYRNIHRSRDAVAKLVRVEELLQQNEVSELWSEGDKITFLAKAGAAYLDIEEETRAWEYLRRALKKARASGDKLALAETLVLVAEAELKQGENRSQWEYRSAEEKFLEASKLCQEMTSLILEVRALLGLSDTLRRLGRLEEAVDNGRDALEKSMQAGYRVGEQEAQYELSRAWQSSGEYKLACSAAREAIKLREVRRMNADRIDLRTSILASGSDYLEPAIYSCLMAGEQGLLAGAREMVFELSDRSRARRLHDTLTMADQDGSDCSRSMSPQSVEAARLAEADAQNRLLAAAGASPEQRKLANRRVDEELESRRKRRRLREVSNGYGVLGSDSPFLSLQAIQKQILGPDTLLLQFDLGDPKSYLWAVTDDSFEVFFLPPASELSPLIADLRHLLAQSYRIEVQGALTDALLRTSKALLGPLASTLDSRKRLAIIADGPLHGIPIGALPHPESVDGADSLLEHHPVVYPLSASSIKWLRSRSRKCAPAPKQIAVIADPVFGRGDGRIGGAEEGGLVTVFDQDSKAGESREELPRLANSGREAEEVLALFAPEERFKLLGFEANRSTVLDSDLGDYRAILFSTHGESHARQPELSRLELSRFDRQGGRREGALYAYQIGKLDLRAELVVLSSCDSALGTNTIGEGPIGLTHSFLAAGAARTLVSLWQVDDEASAALIATFFRHWRAGVGPAEALRHAQLELRAREGESRPFFWAGFVLRGDW